MIQVIIAIGIVCFLLFYFGKSLEDENWALKVLMYSFAFIMFIILSRATIDSTTTCDLVLNYTQPCPSCSQSTIYHYNNICYDNSESNTPSIFYRLTLSIFAIYLIYVIWFMFYKLIMRFWEWISKKIR